MKFAGLFRKIGESVAKNPSISIMLCLTVVIVCGIGLVNVTLDADPETLWVNYNGRAFQEQEYFNEKYGQFYRINALYYRLKDLNDKDDIFQKNYLMYLYAVENAIESATVELNGREYTIDDFCFKPIEQYGCIVSSPLEIWKMDYEALKNDPNVKVTASCVHSLFNDSLACTSRAGYPIQQNQVLGGHECVNNTNGSSCTACQPSARALFMTYLFNNNNFTQNIALKWEKDVFEAIIDSVNNGTFDPTKYGVTEEDIAGMKPIYISYMAQRSISDELVSQTASNAIIIIASYLLMFLYIAVAIGSFPNKVHSSFLLGLGGISIVAFSVIAAVGLLAYFGINLSLISAEVVPFLILAIGVDNMFIIANAYHKLKEHSSAPIPTLIGETMTEVGPSITAAAICEFLVFTVGASTGIPSLEAFCLTAGIAVLFDYLFQIFMFVAFLSLDEYRKQDDRLDCLFCLRAKNPKGPRGFFIRELIEKYYIPFLFNKKTKVGVFVCFFGFLVTSIIGYNNLTLGLEQQVSVPEDSPVYNFFVDQAAFGEIGPEAFVVFKNVDFEDSDNIAVIEELETDLSRLSCCVVPPIYDWYHQFKASMDTSIPGRDYACNATARRAMAFPDALRSFLEISIHSPCCTNYGICGEQYLEDMAFDANGNLESSRFRFFHTPLNTQEDFIQAFVQTRNIVDKYSPKLKGGASAFAYSLFYVYFEQYTYIKGLALTNILLAVAIVYSAILILRNASAGFFVYFCVLITTFDIIGVLWLWNYIAGGYVVQINAVSVVNLITAIGLSVEFNVHIMLRYTRSKGTREERAKTALAEMGSSVIVGITITKFLGVMVLAFAPSPIFRLYYFRMYLAIILMGSFNGLVFLPVLLSLVGPVHKNERKNSSMVAVHAKDV